LFEVVEAFEQPFPEGARTLDEASPRDSGNSHHTVV
jgi:hypothetical protein